jgi:hypothetical protein
MPSPLRNVLASALATLIIALAAPAVHAADRKAADGRKSDASDGSTGLRIADDAREAGAAFARDRDKCDDDKDKHGGVRSSNKHERPDCDDDGDDDDCDGHHGNHGNHNGHDHKKPKECHPSPSR